MTTTAEPTTTITIRAKQADIAAVESIAQQCNLTALGAIGNFQRAFTMAAGIRLLRQAITKDMMADIMELMGTSLGFRTDRDKEPQPYGEDIVKDCAIEAVLRGAHLCGNEFNIIAKRAYITKEFFTRILREFPALTDLKLQPSAPQMSANGEYAYVGYIATWKLNGEPMRLDRVKSKLDSGLEIDERILVKVNKGQGPDAILGKAERKMRAAIYNRLTGSDLTDGDVVDEAGTINARTAAKTLGDLTKRLQEQNGTKDTPAVETPPAGQDASQENGNAPPLDPPADEKREHARPPESQVAYDRALANVVKALDDAKSTDEVKEIIESACGPEGYDWDEIELASIEEAKGRAILRIKRAAAKGKKQGDLLNKTEGVGQ